MELNFKCPVFGAKVTVYIGDKSEFKYLDQTKTTGATAYVIKVETLDGIPKENEYILWISDGENWYYIVHECLHLVKNILKYAGIPFNTNNHELIAYYQIYWVKTIWEGISGSKKD